MLDRTSKTRLATWTMSKFREALYDMKEYYHASIGHTKFAAIAGGLRAMDQSFPSWFILLSSLQTPSQPAAPGSRW